MTSISDIGGNTIAQLQLHILEMSLKHDALISSIDNLCDVQTIYIVYITMKKHIVPFLLKVVKMQIL